MIASADIFYLIQLKTRYKIHSNTHISVPLDPVSYECCYQFDLDSSCLIVMKCKTFYHKPPDSTDTNRMWCQKTYWPITTTKIIIT